MSVKFRPHTISILTPASEGHYDEETGDWVPGGGEEWSDPLGCRYESNGQARTVPIGENRDYVYAYTVYLDKDCRKILNGQMVRLYDEDGQLLGEFASKGFHRWQMHAQLWV